jgi:hypothetical protein
MDKELRDYDKHIPEDELKYEIGQRVHCDWAINSKYAWILKSINGRIAYLESLRNRNMTTNIRSLLYTNQRFEVFINRKFEEVKRRNLHQLGSYS